jgi:choloylglycine hydrolase
MYVTLNLNKGNTMCTTIRKKTTDGACLVGRTMEFGPDLFSQPTFIPVGKEFKTSYDPKADNKYEWASVFASAGMTALGLPTLIDGMNEAGLCVAGLYFPGTASYSEHVDGKTVSPDELPQVLLSQCTDVEDVIRFINESGINVYYRTDVQQDLHWPVTDAKGRSIVIEPLDHRLKIMENPIGVCTNSPDHNWHMRNLSNYVTTQSTGPDEYHFDGYTSKINGAGSGQIGMPGDWTPPSRFVRAAYFAQMMPTAESAIDGVTDIFHVLSTADIVKGCIISTNSDGSTEMEITQYTSCCDTKNKVYYFHTYGERTIHYIDFNDFAGETEERKFNFPDKQTLVSVLF